MENEQLAIIRSLETLRKRKEDSQEELAKKLGTSRSAYSRWLQEDRPKVSNKNGLAIIKYLATGYKPSYVLSIVPKYWKLNFTQEFIQEIYQGGRTVSDTEAWWTVDLRHFEAYMKVLSTFEPY